MGILNKYKVIEIPSKKTEEWLLNKHYAKRKCNVMKSFALVNGEEIVGVCTFGMPPTPFFSKLFDKGTYYDPNEIPSIREHLDNTSAILEQIDGCIEKLRIKYTGLTPAISIEYEYRDDKTNWGFYNPIVAITVMITKKCLESNNIIS